MAEKKKKVSRDALGGGRAGRVTGSVMGSAGPGRTPSRGPPRAPSPARAQGQTPSRGPGRAPPSRGFGQGPGRTPSQGPSRTPSQGPGRTPSQGPGRSPSQGPGRAPSQGPSKNNTGEGGSAGGTGMAPLVRQKRNATALHATAVKMGTKGICEEYAALRAIKSTELTTEAFDAAAEEQKRYKKVVLWDQTRVVLRSSPAFPKSHGDFVHASYVSGFGSQTKKWIIAQGPTSGTLVDFWRMVVQEEIGVVVMLCLVREPGPKSGTLVDKCGQYWGVETGTWVDVVPGVRVETEKAYLDHPIKEGQQIRISHLNLWVQGSRRCVRHFQYMSWGDLDVPRSYDAMVHFQNMVKMEQRTIAQARPASTFAPILVHCSAGVGRSGTFVAIDNCFTAFQNLDSGLFSVRDIVARLRKDRFQAVQTERQYLYIYQVLLVHLRKKRFLKQIELPLDVDTGKSGAAGLHHGIECHTATPVPRKVFKGAAPKILKRTSTPSAPSTDSPTTTLVTNEGPTPVSKDGPVKDTGGAPTTTTGGNETVVPVTMVMTQTLPPVTQTLTTKTETTVPRSTAS